MPSEPVVQADGEQVPTGATRDGSGAKKPEWFTSSSPIWSHSILAVPVGSEAVFNAHADEPPALVVEALAENVPTPGMSPSGCAVGTRRRRPCHRTASCLPPSRSVRKGGDPIDLCAGSNDSGPTTVVVSDLRSFHRTSFERRQQIAARVASYSRSDAGDKSGTIVAEAHIEEIIGQCRLSQAVPHWRRYKTRSNYNNNYNYNTDSASYRAVRGRALLSQSAANAGEESHRKSAAMRMPKLPWWRWFAAQAAVRRMRQHELHHSTLQTHNHSNATSWVLYSGMSLG